MPIDTTPSTVATTALQNIPFSSLIGGPLQAAIQAQSQAAMTTWDFIQAVGLTGPEEDRHAVSVVFQYQKGGQMVNLVVPLLAIVPIPYISIDTMTIDFKANISASSSSVVEQSSSEEIGGSASASVSVGWGIFSAKADFNANYSSKKDSTATEESKYSVEYTMDIHVAASQSAMPAGLASILNILQSSITDSPTTGNLAFSPGNFTLANAVGNTQSILVTVTDSKGLVAPDINVSIDPGKLPDGLVLDATKLTGTTDSKGQTTLAFLITTAATDNSKLPATVSPIYTAQDVPNPVTKMNNNIIVNGTFSLTAPL